MSHADTAVILAGGLGTRLRPEVADVPKPMAPVRGRPFLEYQMDYWIGQGIKRFVLSVGYMREKIIDHFGERYRGVPIAYAIEETPLGTGGGLLRSIAMVDDGKPILVLNGDTYFEVGLDDFMEFHVQRGSEWSIALFESKDTERYMGMTLREEDGKIENIASNAGGQDASSTKVNGGVYLVNADILHPYAAKRKGPVSLEDELMANLFNEGRRFFGKVYAGKFIDIGIPEDYRRAERVLPDERE